MKLIFILLTLCIVISCDKTPGEPKNPMFSGTTYIEITSPTNAISVNNPTFVWQSAGTPYEIAGIFTNKISVEGKKIVNSSDCIALWSTGFSGSAGNVALSSFRKCVGGSPTSDSFGTLTNGNYYWAVWGEDDKLTVTHSSKMVSFSY